MNRKFRGTITILVIIVFALVSVGCGNTATTTNSTAQNTPVIRAALQGAYDTWPAWELAQGDQAKNGFQLKMTYFDSGPQQIEALASDQFDIAQIGPAPAMVGALKYNLQIIGIADDESLATAILARPDSPILKTKGFNTQYPEVYGTPQDLKGKDVFVSTVTTGEVLLINYLKALGLTEKDVHITNMEQPQMLSAFASGKGDTAVMWSPFTYTGFDKGWKVVADASTAKAPAVIFIVATKKFCDQHPDLVEKYLDAYMKKEVELKKNEATLSTEYSKYLKEWSALTWDEKLAQTDMQKHLTYDLKAQLDWFDNSKGPSRIESLLSDASAAFTAGGKFTPQEREQLVKFDYLNTTFLKNLGKSQGLIK
ncbi:NrtA/SsuA/CpmA family ABC transporter substrate-binding protein [Desulfosporosinus sp. SB140]|uniref:NrtA/SsuA/CpmA family ABC transporter substrate-binding protein n=1 Tax=Desulfosporosinus paludis TaxID=3115649 RepID=UPI0038908C1F